MTTEIAKTKPAKPDPLAEVIAWLVAGQKEADIEAAVGTMFPKANVKKLLKRATDHFEQQSSASQNVIVGWALEAYRELYRKSVDIGDYGAAAKIVKDLTALAKMLPWDDPPA